MINFARDYNMYPRGHVLLYDSYGMTPKKAYTEEEIKCAEEYNKFIMTDRNAEMVKKALDFLKNGKSVFYVVGEAHMLGDDGLVNKLTEAGYTVELVKFD